MYAKVEFEFELPAFGLTSLGTSLGGRGIDAVIFTSLTFPRDERCCYKTKKMNKTTTRNRKTFS